MVRNILRALRANIPTTQLRKGADTRIAWLSDHDEPYYLEVHNQLEQQNHNQQKQQQEQQCRCPRRLPSTADDHLAMMRTTRPGPGLDVLTSRVMPIIFTLLLASQFTVIFAINAVAEGETKSSAVDNSVDSRSMFTTKNNTSIIAQRGGVAVLPCSVRINSQATVSWIRRQDYKLLTVGQENLSSDERFVSEFGRHLGHASLRIKSVRSNDNGYYECQLSSYPPQSIFVELKVTEVMTEIGDGGTDIHIDEGSQLRLECRLRYATEVPTFAFWYFGDRMINYDLDEGYLVEDVSKFLNGTGSNLNANFMISVLIVESVNKKHAGNYSCSPSNAKSVQVTVHVLHDEKPAAMQHANRGNNFKLNFTLASIIFLFVIRVLGVTLS